MKKVYVYDQGDPKTYVERLNAEIEARLAKLPTMEEYIRALTLHDWFFYYSDDPSVYKAGQEQHDNILSMRRKIDPDGAVYKKYVPVELQ